LHDLGYKSLSGLLWEDLVETISPLCADPRSFENRRAMIPRVNRHNELREAVERTIALRPYPALKLFRDAMYASLRYKLPPDVWDYQRRSAPTLRPRTK
jgi:hypothetical protein